jgi:hypothetical protein
VVVKHSLIVVLISLIANDFEYLFCLFL